MENSKLAVGTNSQFWRRGEPYVWLTAAGVAISLLLTGVLICIVVSNGAGYFWPNAVVVAELTDGSRIQGEITKRELIPGQQNQRIQLKTGNRDLYGQDFRWIDVTAIRQLSYPSELIVFERFEYGNFYGFVQKIETDDQTTEVTQGGAEALKPLFEQVQLEKKQSAGTADKLAHLNDQISGLEAEKQKRRYQNPTAVIDDLESNLVRLQAEFQVLLNAHETDLQNLRKYKLQLMDANDQPQTIVVADVVRFYQPNQMTQIQKVLFYAAKVKELLFSEPREANTEGGIFPAIFGTVVMVFMMSFFAMPFGVVAAVYLREYAKDGWFVGLVRIAVNNLAGVPSIVYGIFGLGFFIYGLGSGIDSLFFAERLPTPTFGTGGLLWASLTMALLTVPVIIVSTEEGLTAVPRGMREGALALGATKLQTLWRVVLPQALPGIMTGFILAMARAAGEVAPLMIVGVVKLAPARPFDGNFPFFHLDRKFMHLGFHIYDVGFQSPNVEAAKPMVFVTTLVLVGIVLLMSVGAIYLRNSLRKKYALGTF